MRFLCLLLVLATSSDIIAQQGLLDSLNKELKNHRTHDTIRIELLNQLSLRVLKTDPEQALALDKEARILSQELGYKRGTAAALNNYAAYELLKGNAQAALSLSLEAIQMGEQLHDSLLLAHAWSTLGNVYHNQLTATKAIHALKEAMRFNSSAHDALVASKILNIRGSIARDELKYDSALIFYSQALDIIERENEPYRLAEVLNNIGVIYHRQNRSNMAVLYYARAMTAARDTHNKSAEAMVSANYGYTFLSEKKYDEAKRYLENALRLAREMGERKNLSSTYMALMQMENERGDFKEAHRYMMNYYKLKDSLLNADKARQIAELEIRYETQKKELAIQLLERQNKIQELRANILVGVVAFLIASAVSLYLFQRNRENKNRKILNLEIDYLTSRHRELSEKFKTMLSEETKSTESIDQRLLRKAIEVVESNLSDPLFGVEKLGREMGMSRTNLHRKIKAITGFPPSELIRSIRLRKAAALLLRQADTVSQISFAVGFEDQSYFSKSFKKQFGVPPSEYVGSFNQSPN